MEVPISYNGTKVTCNKVSITGNAIINNATLILNLDKAARIPDNTEITVFSNIGIVSGTGFTTILPEQPSSTQVWDTSTLLTDGKIRILNKEEYTAIEGITSDQESTDELYDLNGRPVSSDYRGIVIKGKKKILKK